MICINYYWHRENEWVKFPQLFGILRSCHITLIKITDVNDGYRRIGL